MVNPETNGIRIVSLGGEMGELRAAGGAWELLMQKLAGMGGAWVVGSEDEDVIGRGPSRVGGVVPDVSGKGICRRAA